MEVADLKLALKCVQAEKWEQAKLLGMLEQEREALQVTNAQLTEHVAR